MDPELESAWTILRDMLSQWGLESLFDAARGMLVAGDPAELIPIKLQETTEYKERFKANEARRAKGLPVLSPAEYIENEAAYQNVLRRYGLPEGFYDDRDDFTRWLEADVSPNEIEDRVANEVTRYLSAPADERSEWARLYGITPDIAIAELLDPERGKILRERQMAAVSISTEASRAFEDTYELDVARAEELAARGVTRERAAEGFQDVAGRLEQDQFLGRLAGQRFTQRELEDEALVGDADVARRRRRALEQEEGRFAENYLGFQRSAFAGESQF